VNRYKIESGVANICNNNNNHSSLLSLWNLKIMNDTLRLLSFHLRMLPYVVTIAYEFIIYGFNQIIGRECFNIQMFMGLSPEFA
jgi:hypothetical protein